MNRQLLRIKAVTKTILRRFMWLYDTYAYRHKMTYRKLNTIDNKRIVILAPHSDDEWVGCSRLITSGDNSITIIDMDMPGGDDVSLHKKRYLEMEGVAQRYKTQLLVATGDKKSFLIDYLSKNIVDMVFIPSFFDWHDEHISVMEIFDSAAREVGYKGLVAMYQVSIPIPPSFITHCSGMSKLELKNKWRNLRKYYPSQKRLPFKRFLINERINGAIIREYAIEAYAVMNFEKWSSCLKTYMFNGPEREFLYSKLQDIGKIRKMISKYVEEKA